ncbi:hypothetical protein BLNAU_2569 [Blattamonas nauphoetae]|uniref:Dynein heavy chain n=1 Tax=Blattamonas nauphoetae TaxID=2049346 RepID=A0ABQ9YEW8_9EUKA|nr:hypothetical protein BLNAU_2569 [Blattamonas nauphoetae]
MNYATFKLNQYCLMWERRLVVVYSDPITHPCITSVPANSENNNYKIVLPNDFMPRIEFSIIKSIKHNFSGQTQSFYEQIHSIISYRFALANVLSGFRSMDASVSTQLRSTLEPEFNSMRTLFEEGVEIQTWNSPSMGSFVDSCLSCFLSLQTELRRLNRIQQDFNERVDQLRAGLICTFPTTPVSFEEFERLQRQTVEKQNSTLSRLRIEQNRIGKALQVNHNYPAALIIKEQRKLVDQAIKQTVLEGLTTLRDLLQSDQFVIDIPVLWRNGDAALLLGTDENTGIGEKNEALRYQISFEQFCSFIEQEQKGDLIGSTTQPTISILLKAITNLFDHLPTDLRDENIVDTITSIIKMHSNNIADLRTHMSETILLSPFWKNNDSLTIQSFISHHDNRVPFPMRTIPIPPTAFQLPDLTDSEESESNISVEHIATLTTLQNETMKGSSLRISQSVQTMSSVQHPVVETYNYKYHNPAYEHWADYMRFFSQFILSLTEFSQPKKFSWIVLNNSDLYRQVSLHFTKLFLPFKEYLFNGIRDSARDAFLALDTLHIHLEERQNKMIAETANVDTNSPCTIEEVQPFLDYRQELIILNSSMKEMSEYVKKIRERMKELEKFGIRDSLPVSQAVNDLELKWKDFQVDFGLWFTLTVQEIEQAVVHDLRRVMILINLNYDALKKNVMDVQTEIYDPTTDADVAEILSDYGTQTNALKAEMDKLEANRIKFNLSSNTDDLSVRDIEIRLEEIDKLWCIYDDIRYLYTDGMFSESWNAFLQHQKQDHPFDAHLSSLSHISDQVKTTPLYQEVHAQLSQITGVWPTLVALQTTPIDQPQWGLIFDRLPVLRSSSEARQGLEDGQISVGEVAALCQNISLDDLKEVLERCSSLHQMRLISEEIWNRWSSYSLPYIKLPVPRSKGKKNKKKQTLSQIKVDPTKCRELLGLCLVDLDTMIDLRTRGYSSNLKGRLNEVFAMLQKSRQILQAFISLNYIARILEEREYCVQSSGHHALPGSDTKIFTLSDDTSFLSVRDDTSFSVLFHLCEPHRRTTTLHSIEAMTDSGLNVIFPTFISSIQYLMSHPLTPLFPPHSALLTSLAPLIMFGMSDIFSIFMAYDATTQTLNIPSHIAGRLFPGVIHFSLTGPSIRQLIPKQLSEPHFTIDYQNIPSLTRFVNEPFSIEHTEQIVKSINRQYILSQIQTAYTSLSAYPSFFDWFVHIISLYLQTNTFPFKRQVLHLLISHWLTSEIEEIIKLKVASEEKPASPREKAHNTGVTPVHVDQKASAAAANLRMNFFIVNLASVILLLISLQRCTDKTLLELGIISILGYEQSQFHSQLTQLFVNSQGFNSVPGDDSIVSTPRSLNSSSDGESKRLTLFLTESRSIFIRIEQDVKSELDTLYPHDVLNPMDVSNSQIRENLRIFRKTCSDLISNLLVYCDLIYKIATMSIITHQEEQQDTSPSSNSGHFVASSLDSLLGLPSDSCTNLSPQSLSSIMLTTINPITFEPSVLLPETDLSLDHGDRPPSIPYGLEWIGCSASDHSFLPTPFTIQITSALRHAVYDGNSTSTVSSIVGVIIFHNEVQRTTALQTVTAFGYTLGYNFNPFNCSPITTAETVKRFIISNICDWRWIMFYSFNTLKPHVHLIVTDWLRTIKHARDNLRRSNLSNATIFLDDHEVTVSNPNAPWFVVCMCEDNTIPFSSLSLSPPSANEQISQFAHQHSFEPTSGEYVEPSGDILRPMFYPPLTFASALSSLLMSVGFLKASEISIRFEKLLLYVFKRVPMKGPDKLDDILKFIPSPSAMKVLTHNCAENLRHLMDLIVADPTNMMSTSLRESEEERMKNTLFLQYQAIHAPYYSYVEKLSTHQSSKTTIVPRAILSFSDWLEMKACAEEIPHWVLRLYLCSAHSLDAPEITPDMTLVGIEEKGQEKTITIVENAIKIYFPELFEQVSDVVIPNEIDMSSPENQQVLKQHSILTSMIRTFQLFHANSSIPSAPTPIPSRIIEQALEVRGLGHSSWFLQQTTKLYSLVNSNSVIVLKGPVGSAKQLLLNTISTVKQLETSIEPLILQLTPFRGDIEQLETGTNSLSSMTSFRTGIIRKLTEKQALNNHRRKARRLKLPNDKSSSTLQSRPDDQQTMTTNALNSFPPVWMVLTLTSPLNKGVLSAFRDSTGIVLNPVGNTFQVNFSEYDAMILPQNSRLFISVTKSIFSFHPSILNETSILSFSMPEQSMLRWKLSGLSKDLSELLPPDLIQASVLFFRVSFQRSIHFVSTFQANDPDMLVLPVVSQLNTSISLLKALIALHIKRITTEIDMEIMRLFIVYAIMWGIGGHFASSTCELKHFPEWFRMIRMEKHAGFGDTSGENSQLTRQLHVNEDLVLKIMRQFQVKEKISDQFGSSFEQFVRETFGYNVLYEKEGSIFDYFPDSSEKVMKYPSALNAVLSLIDCWDDIRQLTPDLASFTPLIVIALNASLLAYSRRNVIILNDDFICNYQMSYIVASLLNKPYRDSFPKKTSLFSHHSRSPHPNRIMIHAYSARTPLVLRSLPKSIRGDRTQSNEKDQDEQFNDILNFDAERQTIVYAYGRVRDEMTLMNTFENESDKDQSKNMFGPDPYLDTTLVSPYLEEVLHERENSCRFADRATAFPEDVLHAPPSVIVCDESIFKNPRIHQHYTVHASPLTFRSATMGDFWKIAKLIWKRWADEANLLNRAPPSLDSEKTFFLAFLAPASIFLHMLISSTSLNIYKPSGQTLIDLFISLSQFMVHGSPPHVSTALWTWETTRLYSQVQGTSKERHHIQEIIEEVFKLFLGHLDLEENLSQFYHSSDSLERIVQIGQLGFHRDKSLPIQLLPGTNVVARYWFNSYSSSTQILSLIDGNVQTAIHSLIQDHKRVSTTNTLKDKMLRLNSHLCMSPRTAQYFYHLLESLRTGSRPVIHFDLEGINATMQYTSACAILNVKHSLLKLPTNNREVVVFLNELAHCYASFAKHSALNTKFRQRGHLRTGGDLSNIEPSHTHRSVEYVLQISFSSVPKKLAPIFSFLFSLILDGTLPQIGENRNFTEIDYPTTPPSFRTHSEIVHFFVGRLMQIVRSTHSGMSKAKPKDLISVASSHIRYIFVVRQNQYNRAVLDLRALSSIASRQYSPQLDRESLSNISANILFPTLIAMPQTFFFLDAQFRNNIVSPRDMRSVHVFDQLQPSRKSSHHRHPSSTVVKKHKSPKTHIGHGPSVDSNDFEHYAENPHNFFYSVVICLADTWIILIDLEQKHDQQEQQACSINPWKLKVPSTFERQSFSVFIQFVDDFSQNLLTNDLHYRYRMNEMIEAKEHLTYYAQHMNYFKQLVRTTAQAKEGSTHDSIVDSYRKTFDTSLSSLRKQLNQVTGRMQNIDQQISTLRTDLSSEISDWVKIPIAEFDSILATLDSLTLFDMSRFVESIDTTTTLSSLSQIVCYIPQLSGLVPNASQDQLDQVLDTMLSLTPSQIDHQVATTVSIALELYLSNVDLPQFPKVPRVLFNWLKVITYQSITLDRFRTGTSERTFVDLNYNYTVLIHQKIRLSHTMQLITEMQNEIMSVLSTRTQETVEQRLLVAKQLGLKVDDILLALMNIDKTIADDMRALHVTHIELFANTFFRTSLLNLSPGLAGAGQKLFDTQLLPQMARKAKLPFIEKTDIQSSPLRFYDYRKDHQTPPNRYVLPSPSEVAEAHRLPTTFLPRFFISQYPECIGYADENIRYDPHLGYVHINSDPSKDKHSFDSKGTPNELHFLGHTRPLFKFFMSLMSARGYLRSAVLESSMAGRLDPTNSIFITNSISSALSSGTIPLIYDPTGIAIPRESDHVSVEAFSIFTAYGQGSERDVSHFVDLEHNAAFHHFVDALKGMKQRHESDPSKRVCVLLVNGCDSTVTPAIQHLLNEHLQATQPSLSPSEYVDIRIPAEESTDPRNLTFEDTIQVPFHSDIIVVASQDRSGTYDGYWMEWVKPIILLPTDDTFAPACMKSIHQTVVSLAQATLPADADEINFICMPDALTLVDRLGQFHSQKVRLFRQLPRLTDNSIFPMEELAQCRDHFGRNYQDNGNKLLSLNRNRHSSSQLQPSIITQTLISDPTQLMPQRAIQFHYIMKLFTQDLQHQSDASYKELQTVNTDLFQAIDSVTETLPRFLFSVKWQIQYIQDQRKTQDDGEQTAPEKLDLTKRVSTEVSLTNFINTNTLFHHVIKDINESYAEHLQNAIIDADTYVMVLLKIGLFIARGEKRGLSGRENVAFSLFVGVQSLSDSHPSVQGALTEAFDRLNITSTLNQLPQLPSNIPPNPLFGGLSDTQWQYFFVLASFCPAFRPYILSIDPTCHYSFIQFDRVNIDVKQKREAPKLLPNVNDDDTIRYLHNVEEAYTLNQSGIVSHETRPSNVYFPTRTPIDLNLSLTGPQQNDHHPIFSSFSDESINDLRGGSSHDQSIHIGHKMMSPDPIIFQSEALFDPVPMIQHTEPSSVVHQQWIEWLNGDNVIMTPPPSFGGASLNLYQRLLLVLVTRPEQFRSAAMHVVAAEPTISEETVFRFSTLPSVQLSKTINATTATFVDSPALYSSKSTLHSFVTLLERNHAGQLARFAFVIKPALLYPFVTDYNGIIQDIKNLAQLLGRQVTVVDLGYVLRLVEKGLDEKPSLDQNEERIATLWRTVWDHVESLLDDLIQTSSWLVFKRFRIVHPFFLANLSQWIETHLKHTTSNRSGALSIVWLMLPPVQTKQFNQNLQHFSRINEIFIDSLVLRAPFSFQSLLLDTTHTMSEKVNDQFIASLLNYYSHLLKLGSQQAKNFIYVVFVFCCLAAVYTTYNLSVTNRHFVMHQSHVHTLHNLINIFTAPLLTPRRFEFRKHSDFIERWDQAQLLNTIQCRTLPMSIYVDATNQPTFSEILFQTLNIQTILNPVSPSLYPLIVMPTADRAFQTFVQYLNTVHTPTIYIDPSRNYQTGDAEKEIVDSSLISHILVIH